MDESTPLKSMSQRIDTNREMKTCKFHYNFTTTDTQSNENDGFGNEFSNYSL